MWLTRFRTGHGRFEADASAYVDDALGGGAKARFEAHMAGCPRCAQAVADFHGLKVQTRALPEFDAPRSFRLTAAMLAALATISPPAARRQSAGFRLAQGVAVVAIVGFVTVLAVDLGRGSSSNSTTTTLSASTAEANAPVAPEANSKSAPGGPAPTRDAGDSAAGGQVPPYTPGGGTNAQGVTASTPAAPPAEGGRGAGSPAPETPGLDQHAGETASGNIAEPAVAPARAEPSGDSADWVLRALEIGLGAAFLSGLALATMMSFRRRRAR